MSDDEFQDCVDDQIDSQPSKDGPPSTDAEGFTYYTQDGFTHKIPKKWTFEEIFKFETEALSDIFNINSPGNTAMTPEMENFQPTEVVLNYGTKPGRLIFYGDEFTQEEKQKIKEFKDWINAQGNEIPDIDNELMRLLYSKHWNHQKAYDGLCKRTNFCNTTFPVTVNKVVFDLLSQGYLYIAGRDRMYRPILILRSKVLLDLAAFPTAEDIVTAVLMIFEYMVRVM